MNNYEFFGIIVLAVMIVSVLYTIFDSIVTELILINDEEDDDYY